MNKCDECPVRFLPDPCYSMTVGVPRFCEKAKEEASEPDRPYTRLIYERSVGKQAPPPVTTPQPVRNRAARPSVQLTQLRIYMIEQCPARGDKIGEGCNCLHKCSRGYGWFKPGEVSLQECMACVSGQTPRIQGQ